MGSLLGRLFGRIGSDNEDDILGCDMVPSPSILSGLYDSNDEDTQLRPAASGNPFTTIAQAPIRDS